MEAEEFESLAQLMARFWQCSGGSWLLLGGGAPIVTVLYCLRNTRSPDRIQKSLRRSVHESEVAATTYDDNILEALTVENSETVEKLARTLAVERGLELSE